MSHEELKEIGIYHKAINAGIGAMWPFGNGIVGEVSGLVPLYFDIPTVEERVEQIISSLRHHTKQ